MTKHADTEQKVAAVVQHMKDNPTLSQAAACRGVGIKESTFRYHRKKAATGDGNARAVQTTPVTGHEPDDTGGSASSATAITEDELLEEHGIAPEDVIVQRGEVERWGKPDDFNHLMRVKYERKDSMFILPDPAGWEPPPKPEGWDRYDFADGVNCSFIFLTDQHLPYINKPLERATLRYIYEERPALIVCGGDTGDYGVVSSHRNHPNYKAMVSHIHDSITAHLWRLRVAAPNAIIVLLIGNHDERLPNYVEDKAPAILDIRPGALPTDEELPLPSMHFRNIWRLDELGIQLVDETWKLGKFPIAKELTARHGHFTGPTSEKKALEKYGRSQLHGHTHTAQMLYRTKHDPLDIRVSVSSPVMASVEEDGLGYVPEPDWTPGITCGHVWEDGDFVLNIAPFINNNLLLPGGWRVSGEEDQDA